MVKLGKRTWSRWLLVVFIGLGLLLFLLDDVLPGNLFPGQKLIVTAVWGLSAVSGLLVMYGGMTGAYDDPEDPRRSRIFWRCVFGLFFGVIVLGTLWLVVRALCGL